MVEQVLAHEPHVALQLVRLHREVFVEVERDDVPERQALFPVQPHQLVVDADRRAAGGQAQHAVAALGRALADERGDLRGDGLAGLAGVAETRQGIFSKRWTASADSRRAPFVQRRGGTRRSTSREAIL